MIRITVLASALAGALLVPAADASQKAPKPASVEPAEPVAPPRELLPMERDELQRRVRERCGIGSETPDSFLPWYYHYVLGMEFHRAGDDTHALDCLKSAVARRPEPKNGARIYGLWFLDYLPYSALAEVNDRLGYKDCAEDARRLAAALEPEKKR